MSSAFEENVKKDGTPPNYLDSPSQNSSYFWCIAFYRIIHVSFCKY
jgi:hypothetical protein